MCSPFMLLKYAKCIVCVCTHSGLGPSTIPVPAECVGDQGSKGNGECGAFASLRALVNTKNSYCARKQKTQSYTSHKGNYPAPVQCPATGACFIPKVHHAKITQIVTHHKPYHGFKKIHHRPHHGLRKFRKPFKHQRLVDYSSSSSSSTSYSSSSSYSTSSYRY